MRVLVCGGRAYADRSAVWGALDSIRQNCKEGEELTVIEGGAKGADRLAKQWATSSKGVKLETYEAQWGAFGKAAGAIRNQAMLELGKPDLILAFPGGAGTADMVRRSIRHNITIRRFPT